jgi:3',5'-cyclic-AMP phosphodiesterase
LLRGLLFRYDEFWYPAKKFSLVQNSDGLGIFMNMTKKVFLSCVILFGLTGFLLGTPANLLSSGGQAPYHIVLLGDPHLPGKFLAEKEAVLRTINTWSDVALVVAMGDICEDLGTEQEYAAARQYFDKLVKPMVPVPGNHDFIYSDIKMLDGKSIKGSAAEKQNKLAKFQKTFGIPALHHTKLAGNYKLIFLATDDTQSDQLTRLSQKQLDWLRSELKSDNKKPTIIFFHGPLSGTVSSDHKYASSIDFIAQPQAELQEIIQKNPQIFLWVCGHMHVPATSKDFRADINLYENQVYTLHNSDMNRATIWTNSLILFSDKVVIKTYNHRLGAWSPELEKTLVPPRL